MQYRYSGDKIKKLAQSSIPARLAKINIYCNYYCKSLSNHSQNFYRKRRT